MKKHSAEFVCTCQDPSTPERIRQAFDAAVQRGEIDSTEYETQVIKGGYKVKLTGHQPKPVLRAFLKKLSKEL